MHLFWRGACRTRIGSDDVLTGIDALTNWRWCSPTCKPALGRTGIGTQGYDSLVRFNCLLIGQWHPKAGAGVENLVGFHAVSWLRFASVPDATTRCRFRNPR
ncbi:MAG: hypothetical protein GDA36_01095 [Rhodobacteraceae bacterium]|nr:hypothetical protein [Paracoccaceae bacterium]